MTVSVTFFFSCKNKEKGSPGMNTPSASIDSFLITDSSWGLITASTTPGDLVRIFGQENVKNVRECDEECMDSIDVTKIYPGQKNEITIQWNGTAYQGGISMIQSFNEQPDWHSAEGIRMGSGLKDLLKVNGAKVSLYGFGWDYSGMVTGYNGGKLDSSRIGYRFHLDYEFPRDSSLVGEVGVDTDMPALKAVMDKVTVSWILLSFYKAEQE